MSKHQNPEDNSERRDELSVAYVTDSQEKIEQPTGKLKNVFKKMANELRRSLDNNSAKNSNIPMDDSSAELSSRSVDSRTND